MCWILELADDHDHRSPRGHSDGENQGGCGRLHGTIEKVEKRGGAILGNLEGGLGNEYRRHCRARHTEVDGFDAAPPRLPERSGAAPQRVAEHLRGGRDDSCS